MQFKKKISDIFSRKKDLDINEHERLSSIRHGHKLKKQVLAVRVFLYHRLDY